MGIDAWVSPLAYDGFVREAVARVKYRNARAPLAPLVDLLAAEIRALPRVDVVTWPPTTVPRSRSRGFDHAQLLARGVGARLALPVRPLLRRLDATAQTGAGLSRRRLGPCFEATDPVPPAVLVVDDVATSGATLRNAAAALRGQGCKRVIAATVARTLLKHAGADTEKPSRG